MNIMFFDVQTIGFPDMKSDYNQNKVYTQLDKFHSARMIKISWLVSDQKGNKLLAKDFIIKPDNFEITNSDIHGITMEKATNLGKPISEVASQLEEDTKNINLLVAHNFKFHFNILCSELYRYEYYKMIDTLQKMKSICTAEQTKELLKMPLKSTYYIEKYKMPKLEELYKHCFKEKMLKSKDSKEIVNSLSKIFFYLVK